MANVSTDYLEWSVLRALTVFFFTMLLAVILIPSIYFVSLDVFDHQLSAAALVLICSPIFTIPLIYLKLGADSTFDDKGYLKAAGVKTVVVHVLSGVTVSALLAAASFVMMGAAPSFLILVFGPVYSIVAGIFTVVYLAREHYDEGVNPFLSGLLHRP